MTATRANVWKFEPGTLVLALYVDGRYMYEVDLEDCTTSAQTLDWIAQVAKKTWATDVVLADLVRALNDVLNVQATLCSGGQSKKIADVKRLVWGRRVRPVTIRS